MTPRPRVELRLIFFSLFKFILTLPCKVFPAEGSDLGKNGLSCAL